MQKQGGETRESERLTAESAEKPRRWTSGSLRVPGGYRAMLPLSPVTARLCLLTVYHFWLRSMTSALLASVRRSLRDVSKVCLRLEFPAA